MPKHITVVDFDKRTVETIPYKSGWSDGLSWEDWLMLSAIFNEAQRLGVDQYVRINDMLKAKLAETRDA